MADGKVIYEVRADTSKIDSDMAGVSGKIKGLSGGIAKAAGAVLTGTIAAAAAVGTASAKIGMDFDKEMSQVKAVSGATQTEFLKMRDAAIEWGSKTVYSATESAAAMTELSKLGFTAEQAVSALPGVLDGAAASGAGLAESASVTAAAINLFGLEADQATHVADVFAQSANQSGTDFLGLGESLKFVGTSAANSGMSLEETVAVLEVLADAGMDASQSGTGLRQAMASIKDPTDKAIGAMTDLGLYTEEAGSAFYDAQGNFVGMDEVTRLLQDSLAGLTQQEQEAALGAIFTTNGMTAMQVVMGTAPGQISAAATSLTELEGAAKATAETMTDNLAGDMENLSGTFESMAIQINDGMTPALRNLAQSADEMFSTFASEGYLDALVENFAAFAEILGENLLAVIPQVLELFTELFDLLIPVIDETLPVLIELFFAFLEPLIQLIEAVLPMALELFNELAPLFLAFAEDILPLLVEMFVSFLEPLYELVENLLPIIIELFNDIIPILLEIADMIMPVLIKVFEELLPPIMELIDNLLPPLLELFEALIEPLLELVDELLPILAGLFEVISEVIGPVVEIIGILAEAFSQTLMPVLELLKPLLNFVADILKAIANVIGTVVNGIKELFGIDTKSKDPVLDVEKKKAELDAKKSKDEAAASAKKKAAAEEAAQKEAARTAKINADNAKSEENKRKAAEASAAKTAADRASAEKKQAEKEATEAKEKADNNTLLKASRAQYQEYEKKLDAAEKKTIEAEKRADAAENQVAKLEKEVATLKKSGGTGSGAGSSTPTWTAAQSAVDRQRANFDALYGAGAYDRLHGTNSSSSSSKSSGTSYSSSSSMSSKTTTATTKKPVKPKDPVRNIHWEEEGWVDEYFKTDKDWAKYILDLKEYDAAIEGTATAKASATEARMLYESGLYDLMGYAKGLDNVPYDDFPALLHKGEMIMPATEAHLYRAGLTGEERAGSSSNVDSHDTNVGSITINPNAQQWGELMTLLQQSNDAQRMRRAGGY